MSRPLPPFCGPRSASYEIRLDGRSYASSSSNTRASALSELDYWAREGRLAVLFRNEFCPVPMCDGYGEIHIPRRGRQIFGTTKPCPCHVPMETVEEARTAMALHSVSATHS
jgi:hypothetical protein